MKPKPTDTTARVLRLTLTRQWFVMILRGIKREEYRAYKLHWWQRLMHAPIPGGAAIIRDYDYIEFRNGYATDAPTMVLECKGIRFGRGNADWGAPDYNVFIIGLGDIVATHNVSSLY